jgi:prevent-host-death family protein
MSEGEPVIQRINASRARREWSRLLTRVLRCEARVIVEKNGTPVAAIITADDLRRLTWMEADRRERFKGLDRLREAFKDVPPDEIEAEVAQALADVRQENRWQRPISAS